MKEEFLKLIGILLSFIILIPIFAFLLSLFVGSIIVFAEIGLYVNKEWLNCFIDIAGGC